MKYDLKTVSLLIFLFLVSQIVGLSILYKDIEVKVVEGVPTVTHGETALGPRPELYGWETFAWVMGGIVISTSLVLIIVWLKKVNWWRIMFFLSVFLTISLALGVLMEPLFALIIAFLIALIKIFRPNPIIHNVAEVLMYSGIAVLLVPLFELEWIVALLVVISLYDIYAVWKSKHMVKMAEFQTKSSLFAGISISHGGKKGGRKGKKKGLGRAIIGGGDVAFPLIFSGVVMEGLIKTVQLSKEIAFLKALIIPFIVGLTLIILLLKGEEGKYYPGMPFITTGCLIAYAVVSLI